MLPPGQVFKQGEHILICGTTGCGKTTLASEILLDRKFLVTFKTKVKDDSYKKLRVKEIQSWPPKAWQTTRVMVAAKVTPDIEATIARREWLYKRVFGHLSLDTGWTIYCDETLYQIETLHMSTHIAALHEQGRSAGETMVLATQRPSRIPLLVYSGTTHFFVFNTTFEDDVKRLADLGGIRRKELAVAIQSLDKHSYIYVNKDTKKMLQIPGMKG
jgi:hypothetical protein